MIYVYDKRVGKVVEKRSRDNIALVPIPGPQWWLGYLKMMEDCHDIMSGREPQYFK